MCEFFHCEIFHIWEDHNIDLTPCHLCTRSAQEPGNLVKMWVKWRKFALIKWKMFYMGKCFTLAFGIFIYFHKHKATYLWPRKRTWHCMILTLPSILWWSQNMAGSLQSIEPWLYIMYSWKWPIQICQLINPHFRKASIYSIKLIQTLLYKSIVCIDTKVYY